MLRFALSSLLPVLIWSACGAKMETSQTKDAIGLTLDNQDVVIYVVSPGNGTEQVVVAHCPENTVVPSREVCTQAIATDLLDDYITKVKTALLIMPNDFDKLKGHIKTIELLLRKIDEELQKPALTLAFKAVLEKRQGELMTEKQNALVNLDTKNMMLASFTSLVPSLSMPEVLVLFDPTDASHEMTQLLALPYMEQIAAALR